MYASWFSGWSPQPTRTGGRSTGVCGGDGGHASPHAGLNVSTKRSSPSIGHVPT